MRRRFSEHLPESTAEIIRSMERMNGKAFARRLAAFLEIIQMRELVYAAMAQAPNKALINYQADALTESIVAKVLASVKRSDHDEFIRIASHLNVRRGTNFLRVAPTPKYRKSKKP